MTSVVNRRTEGAKEPSGPCAPLYLLDLAELVHSHLSTRTTKDALHYPRMRALFERHKAHRLHTTGPPCIPVAMHTQHLYQGVILFVHSPSIVTMLCCSHQQPQLISNCTALTESNVVGASIALLVLLRASQPPPAEERIRLDLPTITRIRAATTALPEAQALLNSIATVDGLRLVAQLRHAPAPAPMDITESLIHPLAANWSPQNWFGLVVSPTEATAALAARKPICSSHTSQCPVTPLDPSVSQFGVPHKHITQAPSIATLKKGQNPPSLGFGNQKA